MAGNVSSAQFGPRDRFVKGSPSLSELRTRKDCQLGSTEEIILEQTVQAGCVGARQNRIWRQCPSLGIWEWLDASRYK